MLLEFARSARLGHGGDLGDQRPGTDAVYWRKKHRGTAMPSKLSSLQAGTLGELLTVAKLNTLGHAAYISPEGAPGHDVIVIIGGQPRSIEVKTRQFRKRATEITRWPVDIKAKHDADFFIFIELNLMTLAPSFYLLTNAQARQTHRDYASGGNCIPAQVRQLVGINDFSALSADGSADSL